jgi:peptide chain release factor 3
VGLVNATGLQLGDTIHTGDPVTFPPIPRFSPEVFATARPLDTGKTKQFRKGLEQLDEEGVVQVLRDAEFGDSSPVLAAVGQLQFEVFGHRLANEFNAPAEILSAGYQAIRRTDKASVPRLREIGGIRILNRSDGELVALFENKYRLARLEADEPELLLEPLVAGAIPTY